MINRLGCRFEMLEIATNERDIRAGYGKRSRHPASDARAAPGNEGNMTFQDVVSEDFHVAQLVKLRMRKLIICATRKCRGALAQCKSGRACKPTQCPDLCREKLV